MLTTQPAPPPSASVTTPLSGSVIALLVASGAQQTPHSGRTLLGHLQGTYLLLQSWGNTDAVCLAGLFHSIYGTNAFTHQSLLASQRADLQAAIGAEAEALAWLFCSIDRPHAILQSLQQGNTSDTGNKGDVVNIKAHKNTSDQTNALLSITPQQLQALAEIECANLVEQSSWSSALKALYCAALDGTATLSQGALAALRTGWAHKLAQPVAASVPATPHVTACTAT